MYNYNTNKDPVYLKQPNKWFVSHSAWQGRQIKTAVSDLPSGDVTYFPDKHVYRLRVGSIRVMFEVIKGRVTVYKIGSRGDVYKGAK